MCRKTRKLQLKGRNEKKKNPDGKLVTGHGGGGGGLQLTVGGGARLALEAERRPEARAVVEAPAFLHLGRAGALRADVRHRRAPVVHRRRLSVLYGLTSRARQPHPLLEAQLLTAGREKGGGGGNIEMRVI